MSHRQRHRSSEDRDRRHRSRSHVSSRRHSSRENRSSEWSRWDEEEEPRRRSGSRGYEREEGQHYTKVLYKTSDYERKLENGFDEFKESRTSGFAAEEQRKSYYPPPQETKGYHRALEQKAYYESQGYDPYHGAQEHQRYQEPINDHEYQEPKPHYGSSEAKSYYAPKETKQYYSSQEPKEYYELEEPYYGSQESKSFRRSQEQKTFHEPQQKSFYPPYENSSSFPPLESEYYPPVQGRSEKELEADFYNDLANRKAGESGRLKRKREIIIPPQRGQEVVFFVSTKIQGVTNKIIRKRLCRTIPNLKDVTFLDMTGEKVEVLAEPNAPKVKAYLEFEPGSTIPPVILNGGRTHLFDSFQLYHLSNEEMKEEKPHVVRQMGYDDAMQGLAGLSLVNLNKFCVPDLVGKCNYGNAICWQMHLGSTIEKDFIRKRFNSEPCKSGSACQKEFCLYRHDRTPGTAPPLGASNTQPVSRKGIAPSYIVDAVYTFIASRPGETVTSSQFSDFYVFYPDALPMLKGAGIQFFQENDDLFSIFYDESAKQHRIRVIPRGQHQRPQPQQRPQEPIKEEISSSSSSTVLPAKILSEQASTISVAVKNPSEPKVSTATKEADHKADINGFLDIMSASKQEQPISSGSQFSMSNSNGISSVSKTTSQNIGSFPTTISMPQSVGVLSSFSTSFSIPQNSGNSQPYQTPFSMSQNGGNSQSYQIPFSTSQGIGTQQSFPAPLSMPLNVGNQSSFSYPMPPTYPTPNANFSYRPTMPTISPFPPPVGPEGPDPLICQLCKRKFATQEKRDAHVLNSELHRQNLAAANLY